MAEETEAPLWTQKLKKKKKLRRVSQNTTPTSEYYSESIY
jgi:hypothetical protein